MRAAAKKLPLTQASCVINLDCWEEDYFFLIGRDGKKHTDFIVQQMEKNGHGKVTQDVREGIQKQFYTDCNGRHFHITTPRGLKVHCLWVGEFSTPLAAHEAIHLAWRMLHKKDVPVSVNNQEPLAYLVGTIVRQVQNFAWGIKQSCVFSESK